MVDNNIYNDPLVKLSNTFKHRCIFNLLSFKLINPLAIFYPLMLFHWSLQGTRGNPTPIYVANCGYCHSQLMALASSGYVRDFLMAAFLPKKLRGFGMYLDTGGSGGGAVMVGTGGARQPSKK